MGSAVWAQGPSTSPAPSADYQDAVYTGILSCSPSPDSEYCSNVADKFWVVKLNGKDYALKPGLNNGQMLAVLATPVVSGGHVMMVALHGNVFWHLPPNSPVQVRFHRGGVDVRVLVQTKKGPRFLASHYDIAVSQMEPVHHPPASH